MIESKLVARIKRVCKVLDISHTRFGVDSVNDPNLIPDLDEGRELRHKTRVEVEKYLERLKSKIPKET